VREGAVEWPTLCLIGLTYAVWGMGMTAAYALHPLLGVVITGVAIAQFSSLQHEALHGHPFRWPALNQALVYPALYPIVPYGRFRATHLAHHHDPNLTDPYDDPESCYLDPSVWAQRPGWQRAILSACNTLLGRMVIGPWMTTMQWLWSEARLIATGTPGVARDWLLHLGGLVMLVACVWPAPMGALGYLGAVYLAAALLKIRTFLEHRAHALARARTVIVEDRGPLSILFLNNNLHAVHHMHPNVPWYRLPSLYAANRDHYLARNEGYAFGSYGQIFARYLLRRKEPVPHPLMPQPVHQDG
jgi:fatty acid desaturase